MPTCTPVLSLGTLYYIWWWILFRSVLKCLKPTSVAVISCCPRPHWTTWPYSLHMRSRDGDLRPPGTSRPFTSQKSAHMSPSAHHGPWWSIWPWSTSTTTPKDNVVGARLKVIVGVSVCVFSCVFLDFYVYISWLFLALIALETSGTVAYNWFEEFKASREQKESTIPKGITCLFNFAFSHFSKLMRFKGRAWNRTLPHLIFKTTDKVCLSSLQVCVASARVSVKEGWLRMTAAARRRPTTGCTPTRWNQPVFPHQGTCLVMLGPLHGPLANPPPPSALLPRCVNCWTIRKLHRQTHAQTRRCMAYQGICWQWLGAFFFFAVILCVMMH